MSQAKYLARLTASRRFRGTRLDSEPRRERARERKALRIFAVNFPSTLAACLCCAMRGSQNFHR